MSRLSLLVLALLPVVGCFEGNTNSESHLRALMPCQGDGDCGELECLCGVCTAPCEPDRTCPERVGRAAAEPPFSWEDGACFDLDDVAFALWCESEPAPPPTVCLAPCETDEDCPIMCTAEGACPAVTENARLICHEGACLWEDVSLPSPDFLDDRNNTLEDAQPIELLAASLSWLWPDQQLPETGGRAARLDPLQNPDAAVDRDYFAFEVDGDTWLAIVVAANDRVLGDVDPIVNLLDAEGQLLATANDAVVAARGPEIGDPSWNHGDRNGQRFFDAELIAWVERPGEYIVEVTDTSSRSDADVANLPGDYRLLVGRLDGDAASTVFAEVGATVTVPSNPGRTLLLGAGEALGRSMFRVELPSRAALLVELAGSGPLALDEAIERLVVADSADGSVIARGSIGQRYLSPILEAGAYEVGLSDIAQGGAPLDSVALELWSLEPGPSLDEPPANDTLEAARALDEATSSGWFSFELGPDDTDIFSMAFGNGDNRQLICWSRSAGSGVVGLSLSAMYPSGTVIQDHLYREDASGPIQVPPTGNYPALGGEGPVLLQFRKGGQLDDVAGAWVQCWMGLNPG